VSTPILFGTTAGTFADTSTNAEGAVVPDTYEFKSTIDAAVGVVDADGSATFVAGASGTFDVTATDPAGLSGTETFEIADLVPVAVGTPTFVAS
jgi:hypothetical protein